MVMSMVKWPTANTLRGIYLTLFPPRSPSSACVLPASEVFCSCGGGALSLQLVLLRLLWWRFPHIFNGSCSFCWPGGGSCFGCPCRGSLPCFGSCTLFCVEVYPGPPTLFNLSCSGSCDFR